MDARKISYWATTGLATAILTFGALNELTHSARVVETVAHLGYPAFVPSLLGTWKVLAIVALLVPRFPRLKEWAYAGIFFDVTGAIVSHAMVGDGAAAIAPPMMVLALSLASFALRPKDRVLGTLLPATSGTPSLVAAPR